MAVRWQAPRRTDSALGDAARQAPSFSEGPLEWTPRERPLKAGAIPEPREDVRFRLDIHFLTNLICTSNFAQTQTIIDN